MFEQQARNPQVVIVRCEVQWRASVEAADARVRSCLQESGDDLCVALLNGQMQGGAATVANAIDIRAAGNKCSDRGRVALMGRKVQRRRTAAAGSVGIGTSSYEVSYDVGMTKIRCEMQGRVAVVQPRIRVFVLVEEGRGKRSVSPLSREVEGCPGRQQSVEDCSDAVGRGGPWFAERGDVVAAGSGSVAVHVASYRAFNAVAVGANFRNFLQEVAADFLHRPAEFGLVGRDASAEELERY